MGVVVFVQDSLNSWKRQENLEIYFPSLVLVLTKKQNVRILDEMELLVVGLKDYCIKSICVVQRLFRE